MIVLLAVPPAAQAQDEPSLMERGAELFLEGLRQEMQPAWDDLQGLADGLGPAMRGFWQEMGPALGAIAGKVEDWSVYERPVILPNGDIIIRRKPDPAAPPNLNAEPGADDGSAVDI